MLLRFSHHHENDFCLDCLLSGPVKDCVTEPVGGSVESTVVNLSTDDGEGQHCKENSGFGSSRADAGVDVALEENFDAGGVHEQSGDEVVAYFEDD